MGEQTALNHTQVYLEIFKDILLIFGCLTLHDAARFEGVKSSHCSSVGSKPLCKAAKRLVLVLNGRVANHASVAPYWPLTTVALDAEAVTRRKTRSKH